MKRRYFLGGAIAAPLAAYGAWRLLDEPEPPAPPSPAPAPPSSVCTDNCPDVRAERLFDRAIITPDMDARLGNNIGGPSLVRVPDWTPNPLGKYYLYFAHHRGDHIRMAYADDLAGPWQVYTPGVLAMADTGFIDHHIASPEVVVHEPSRTFRMYFHGVLADGQTQKTSIALSSDGLNFADQKRVLMDTYARVFEHDGMVYGLAMPGQLYRSPDGLDNFEEGPNVLPGRTRHSGLRLMGDTLQIFFTRRGDTPESILCCEVDMSGDWSTWTAGPEKLILAPERDYEGGDLPLTRSRRGPSSGPARQLRDPDVFSDKGRDYLVYAVAGESGLALAELLPSWRPGRG